MRYILQTAAGRRSMFSTSVLTKSVLISSRPADLVAPQKDKLLTFAGIYKNKSIFMTVNVFYTALTVSSSKVITLALIFDSFYHARVKVHPALLPS